MFTQKFIKIFHSVQEIEPFSLLQNLALGKASTDDNCHFAIPWVRSFQHQIVCKISSQYSSQFKRYVHFHFFRIGSSAKPQPMKNVISQSLGLDQEIGPFSRFQNLELGKASTDKECQFAISWARSGQYQCLRRSLSKYSTQFKR